MSFINDYKRVYKYRLTHLWNIAISRVEIGSTGSQQHSNKLQHNSENTPQARAEQLQLALLKPAYSKNDLVSLTGKIRS